MANFLLAHKKTAKNEGGYVNDPSDAGGETYKGWARIKNPTWGGWKVIDSYKGRKNFPACLENDDTLQKLVYVGYVRDYWTPIMGDKIKSQAVANQLYDTAVNTGVSRAIKLCQQSLGIVPNGRMSQDLLDRLNSMS